MRPGEFSFKLNQCVSKHFLYLWSLSAPKQTQAGGKGQAVWADDKRRLSRFVSRLIFCTKHSCFVVLNVSFLLIRRRDRGHVPCWLHPEDYWQEKRNSTTEGDERWRGKRPFVTSPPSSEPRWGMVMCHWFVSCIRCDYHNFSCNIFQDFVTLKMQDFQIIGKACYHLCCFPVGLIM